MGEIGINREDFFHNLKWWEINSIIRGYRRRNRILHQLIAENIFSTIHIMRKPEGKTVPDMFPQIFDDDDEEENVTEYTQEEIDDLQNLMKNYNMKKGDFQ